MAFALLLEDGDNLLLEDGTLLLIEKADASSGAILQESGFSILLESGDRLLLEGVASEPEPPAVVRTVLVFNLPTGPRDLYAAARGAARGY